MRDQFQNVQPDIDAWLNEVELPEVGGLAAQDLVFEAWAMFDRAFDDRLGDVDWRELRELEAEPPALESVQPALAAYVAEQLDNLQDEEPDFGAPRAGAGGAGPGSGCGGAHEGDRRRRGRFSGR